MTPHKALFLTLIFTASSCFSTTQLPLDNHYLETWKSTYVDQMEPQQLQMLGNIVHGLHALSTVEIQIRKFSTPIAQLHQAVRKNIETYKDTTKELEILKKLLERLSYVANTRTIYAQTLSTCTNHYNKKTVQIIDDALVSLQLYAQAQLRDWSNAQTDKTALHLKKCSDAITSSMQRLHVTAGMHKGMSEGQMPMHLTPENEENKSLLVLSLILQNNSELLNVTDSVINTINETSDHAAQIIYAGEHIYKQFYTIIYDTLMLPSANQHYATTLFSMHDILPDEHKSLLPNPHHVFEHMLQTAKMYTQTEFSQL
jgi:hypothetical protein